MDIAHGFDILRHLSLRRDLVTVKTGVLLQGCKIWDADMPWTLRIQALKKTHSIWNYLRHTWPWFLSSLQLLLNRFCLRSWNNNPIVNVTQRWPSDYYFWRRTYREAKYGKKRWWSDAESFNSYGLRITDQKLWW